MSQQTKSLRLRRTQKLLREALVELIEEQGFEALTVTEITERAMVSRAAFYRNYQDKYDLVERIFDEAMQALFDAVSESGADHPPQVWINFFEHVAEYDRLYSALLGRQGSPWFVMKMRAVLIDLIGEYQRAHLPKLDKKGPSPTDGFVPDLVATMFVEALTWWLEHGRPYSSQEIATRCALLVTAIYKEATTWQ